MLKLILMFSQVAQGALESGLSLDKALAVPVRVDIARAKYLPESEMATFDAIEVRIREQLK